MAATLGHFWSFPHALLYAEPPRLVGLGLATENREQHGRRRRTFTITAEGSDAVQEWLARPSRDSTELRDPGLLQLYFADLGSSETPRIIAQEQLAIHRATLGAYEQGARIQRRQRGSSAGDGQLEQWHGHSLRMGTLYERAAVDFWEGVAADAADDEAAVARARAEDDGAAIAPSTVRREAVRR